MVSRLNSEDIKFWESFDLLIERKRETTIDIEKDVDEIINDVRNGGDASILELTERLDGQKVANISDLKVSNSDRVAAVANCESEILDALNFAANRIRSFHEKQFPKNIEYTDDLDIQLGAIWHPIQSVGLYVPGGTASYPSSVLMNALPAKVAGVPRTVMMVPANKGVLSPYVIAAAEIAEVDEIWKIGGAQAIAALAYGSQAINSVDKVVGPGNAWVAAAKRQVFGHVGIDMIAGPSEILVISDNSSNPSWIASDLLSQAEHDIAAQALLITDDYDFANLVVLEIEKQLETLSRSNIARQSLRDFGAIIIVKSLEDEAPDLANKIAPEHLELAIKSPDIIANKITNAGAIFYGRYTPEAIGDYVAGPNHVLPTSRSARFSSGLSVLDFMKRTTTVRCNSKSINSIGPAAIKLAREEGLEAHALSVSVRMSKSTD